MTHPKQTTIMWIGIIFSILMAAVGWSLLATNTSVAQMYDSIDVRLNRHNDILQELIEEKGKTRSELKYMNKNIEIILERTEHKK